MKFRLPVTVLLGLLLAACGHKPDQVQVPPPPPIAGTPSAQTQVPAVKQPVVISDLPSQQAAIQKQVKEAEAQKTLAEEQAKEEQELADALPQDAKPIAVETGIASWYGAPYHNRRGSNGEVYNMHAMTAAHRTLPLGSIVRVINLKTGSTALVRITDRGPFIPGRIIDLSLAAAKKLDVWGPGLAEVRLEVMQTPAPIDTGGRWAVQIGAFEKEQQARILADHLERRYHTAKIQCFNSPIGNWWIRVLVRDDTRQRAQEVAKDTHTPEGAIFLVRLD
jgi:peptidoglycan lytic transglycosylase